LGKNYAEGCDLSDCHDAASGRTAEEHSAHIFTCPQEIDCDVEASDSFHEIGAVDSESAGVVRSDHDADHAGHQEERDGDLVAGAGGWESPFGPQRCDVAGAGDQDQSLQQRGRERTHVPAHHVKRQARRGHRQSQDGEAPWQA